MNARSQRLGYCHSEIWDRLVVPAILVLIGIIAGVHAYKTHRVETLLVIPMGAGITPIDPQTNAQATNDGFWAPDMKNCYGRDASRDAMSTACPLFRDPRSGLRHVVIRLEPVRPANGTCVQNHWAPRTNESNVQIQASGGDGCQNGWLVTVR